MILAAARGGRTRRKGQIAFQMLTAANRDPAWFTAPDTFDIRRTPNRHVAFGFGAHFCVGATLARVEGSIAVGTLIRCFPGRRLSIGPPQPRTARVTRCGSAPGRPAPASGGRRS
jgi:cytochrome P450